MRHTGALQFGFLQVISLTCFLFLCLSISSEPCSSVDSANTHFQYTNLPIANTTANFTPQNFNKFLHLNTTANYSTTPSDTFSLYANHELCTNTVSDTTSFLQQHYHQTTNTTTTNTFTPLSKNKKTLNSSPSHDQTDYNYQQHNPKLTYHTPTRELRLPPSVCNTAPISLVSFYRQNPPPSAQKTRAPCAAPTRAP